MNNLKLEKIVIKNFGSYEKETSINLTSSPLLLYGDTGSGKSSIIEAIFAGLTGGDLRDGVSLNDMISSFSTDTKEERNKRELMIALFLSKDNVDYKIEIIKTLKSSQKTNLYSKKGIDYELIFSQNEAKEEIAKIVGVSADILLSTNIMKQGEGSFFNKLRKGEKKDMIFEFFNMNLIEKLNQYINSDIKDIEDKIIFLNKTNEDSILKIEELKKTKEERKESISKLEEEKEISTSRISILESKIKNVNELNEKIKWIPEIERRIRNLEIEINEEKNKINELKSSIDILTLSISNIDKEIEDLSNEISTIEKSEKENELKKEKISSLNKINENLNSELTNHKAGISSSIVRLDEILSTNQFLLKSEEELNGWNKEKIEKTLLQLEEKNKELSIDKNNLEKELIKIDNENSKNEIIVNIEKQIIEFKLKNPENHPMIIDLVKEITGLNHEISLLKKSIDSVNHLHEGQCPTCYQSVDNEVKKITLNTLNKKIEEVNLLKEEFEVKKENQTNSIKLQISTKIENLEKDLKQEIENEKNKKIDLKKEISSKIEDITLLIEKNITTIDKIKEGIGKYFSLLEVHNQKSELSLELKSKEADYNQKISVNNIEIKNFQKEIKDIDSDILLNKKETLKSKINDKNNFIQLSNEEKLLEKNLIIFDELKKKLEEGKSIKVDENIEELNNEFFDLKNKIGELEKEIMLIKMKDQELYNLTLNLGDFEIQKNKLNEELGILTEMYQLYSRDGIPTELIKEISEEIENEGNKYLSQFSGGKYAMKFIFEEERKSGKGVKREFDIKILDNDIIRNYSQLSGGEQTRIDWAQHIAFSKVLYKKFNKPFIDLLVIDEGFGTQGEKALNKVINALSILEKEFSNILIISHHPLLQGVFTNHLTVLKDENTGRTIIN